MKKNDSKGRWGRPPLVSAFMRAVVRDLLGVHWPQKRLAEFLTVNGFPTSLDTVKQAKRRGELTLGALAALTTQEAAFAEAVYRADPNVPLERLVAPGSSAAAALETARARTPDRLVYIEGRFGGPSRASVTSLVNQGIAGRAKTTGSRR